MKRIFTESGRSMIEMLGVLAIVGVLSVGGLAGYNMAMGRIRENKFVEEFELLIFNANEAFNNIGLSTGTFDFLDITPLQSAAAAVSGDIKLTKLIRWISTSPYAYYMTFTNLPTSLCLKLIEIPFGEPVCIDDNTYQAQDIINIETKKEAARNFCNSTNKSANRTRFMFNCQN
jgi:type II secretory pathway pseudopilin PulG